MGLPRLDERRFEITSRQARDHFPGVISLVAIALMQKLCQQRGWRGWGGLRDPGTSYGPGTQSGGEDRSCYCSTDFHSSFLVVRCVPAMLGNKRK